MRSSTLSSRTRPDALMAATRYAVDAYNTATASANKIHDDAVAAEYGFEGGLVPGVDVIAYLTRAPVERWGIEWLRHGGLSARLVSPVYDGEQVMVTATDDGDDHLVLVLHNPRGEVCATGEAVSQAPADDRPIPDEAELPDPVPPASPEALTVGRVLGSLGTEFDADAAGAYLADVRETLPIYSGTTDAGGPYAHPAWLLRFSNHILATNVVLGPWIHVSSDIAQHGAVGAGQAIDVHAVVVDEHEKKGHRFVTLDVAVLAEGDLVQRVRHTAIHTPRRI